MTVTEQQKEFIQKQSLGRKFISQQVLTVTEGIVTKLSLMEALGVNANVVTSDELSSGFTVNSEKIDAFKYKRDKDFKPK